MVLFARSHLLFLVPSASPPPSTSSSPLSQLWCSPEQHASPNLDKLAWTALGGATVVKVLPGERNGSLMIGVKDEIVGHSHRMVFLAIISHQSHHTHEALGMFLQHVKTGLMSLLGDFESEFLLCVLLPQLPQLLRVVVVAALTA